MHEADDQRLLRFCSVCVAKSATASPEIKFIEKWKEHLEEHLEYCKDTARRIDGRTNSIHIPRASWCQDRNETVLKIDEWIRQGQGKYRRHFTPGTCLCRVIFMGMLNDIPICSLGPKGGNAQFLQDAERNAAYFGKFKPGYFMCKQCSHLARLHTRTFCSRVWLKQGLTRLKCLDCSISVRVILRRILTQVACHVQHIT